MNFLNSVPNTLKYNPFHKQNPYKFNNVFHNNRRPQDYLKIIGSNRTTLFPQKNIRIDHMNSIFLIYQFFIHSTDERNKELRFCLKKNVENPFINKIYLINERYYSDKELGIKSDKIIQVIKNSRMKFRDTFDLVDKLGIRGYIITGNADIFYDNSIRLLKNTLLHEEKKMFCQLRLEYRDEKDLNDCKPFGNDKFPELFEQGKEFWKPKHPLYKKLYNNVQTWFPNLYAPWCADSWIFHSEMNPKKDERKQFDFYFGIAGIDNRVPWELDMLGWEIANEPYLIRCYHYHKSEIRSWREVDRYDGHYLLIFPDLSYK